MNRNRLIGIIAGAVVLVGIVIVSVFAVRSIGESTIRSDVTEISQTPAPSNKGAITGTGVLEADSTFVVTAGVTGRIIEAAFEEGAAIRAGDVLFRVDQTNLLTGIEKARVGIASRQAAYDQTADNIRKLSVKSGISGTITKLYISKGDMVGAGGKIADVINDDTMTLKVPFIESDANALYIGQSADVTIVGSFYSMTGTVRRVATGTLASASGSVVKIVEIDVKNPGTLRKGDRGTASVGAAACNDAGEFDHFGSETVIAEVAGRVSSLTFMEGDKVAAGGVIVSLTNDAMTDSQRQNALAIDSARLELQTLTNQLKDFNIESAIDGVFIKKNVEKGDTLSAANMQNLGSVADLSKIIFRMNIDEFDVASVHVGQSVKITADAAPGKEFSGTVEFLSVTGKQVAGVSLYEVKVAVDDSAGLMPGMNVNGAI